jgi:hypothetical protein
MKHKNYTKPTMKIVEVQHTQMLLTSDPEGVTSERRSYGRAVEEDWE